MLRMLLQLAANIPAALVGGGVFLFALSVLQLGGALSLFVGLCGYVIGGVWVFPAGNLRVVRDRQDLLRNVVKDGERKLEQMRRLSHPIQQYDVRKKIVHICDVAEKIFDTVKKNPEDVKTAQHFSVYYLDATVRILTKYVNLSEHKAYSPEVNDALKQVESVLDTVQAAFERQLSSVLRNHMLDLDSEIAVLEETINIVGM